MQFFNAAIFLTGLCFLNHNACLGQKKENPENLKITVEFETPDFQLFTDNTYTPVTTFRGNTYFVWIDKNFRPKIGKIENGKVSTTFLDPDPEYRVLNNKHHRFSIGVDQDGYLHVAGDMHHYPKSATDHLPGKYRDGIIMYWVSNKPEDISRFSWLGKNKDRALPGYGFTYLSFHHDMDGELYARCRNRVYIGSHNPGEMGYSIYRYDTDSKRWKNLGGKAPSNPTATWNSVIWEDDAHKKKNVPDFYQGFLGQIRFDFNNRLHIAGAVNNNTAFDAASHVLYAYSDDLGNSFYRADGSKIKSLPIRVEAGNGQGDIVDGPDKFATFASASFDIEGNPVVTYTRMNDDVQYGMDPAYYKYLDHGKWSKRLSYPSGGHVKNIPVVDANGVINFLNNSGKIMRTMNLGSPGYSIDIGGSFVSIDERAIREQNILRGMMLKDNKLQIVSLEFTPKKTGTLSSPWSTANLGTAKGTSNSFNSVYQFKSSGDGFSSNAVNGHLCYQKLVGDGAIEARIININYTDDNAFAGIMVTESLNSGAFYSNVITHHGLKTYYNTGDQIKTGEKFNNKQPCEWLRITREGNKLSAYGSNNGKSWYLVDERTIILNQEVFIGIIAGSGNNTQGHARVDHLEIKKDALSGIEILKHPIDVITTEGDHVKFEVEANATSELTFQWLKDGTEIAGADQQAFVLQQVNQSDAGNYQVKLSSGSTNVLSNKARLIVNELPQEAADCSKLKLEAEIENESCKGKDGKIKLVASGGLPPYVYAWSHGPRTNNLSNLTMGNYTVTITDQAGCRLEKNIVVNAQPGPAKPLIFQSGYYLQTEESPGLSVEWYFNGSLIEGTPGKQISITKSGKYAVIVTDSNGCFAASDELRVERKTVQESLHNPNAVVQSLHVYPVPASTTLNIDILNSVSAGISYQIFSMAGDLLLNSDIDHSSEHTSFAIDVSSLPIGVHLLKLKVFNEIIIRRFLKQ